MKIDAIYRNKSARFLIRVVLAIIMILFLLYFIWCKFRGFDEGVLFWVLVLPFFALSMLFGGKA